MRSRRIRAFVLGERALRRAALAQGDGDNLGDMQNGREGVFPPGQKVRGLRIATACYASLAMTVR